MDANDPTAQSRKRDHIDLAFQSQVESIELDERFYYEPMMQGHPTGIQETSFMGKTMRAPIWVSSMTGGTQKAGSINTNLARACAEFGMGMGLGSCRSLLFSDDHLADFDVRRHIGDEQLLLANLGIAQVEELIEKDETSRIVDLVGKLDADGLFVHVNPLQEWLQPEGDAIRRAPVDTIADLLRLHPEVPLVVKEVGQGMGRESLSALMQLPLAAIEFAAHGGTNFAKLELLRNGDESREHFLDMTRIGHSAADMVDIVNSIIDEQSPGQVICDQFIISGGVKSFLDGYYLTRKLHANAVYGQASALLKYAAESYEELRHFISLQLKGYAMATAYLRIRQ
jgi:isopentenyl-diphosphate delta-isomerase